MHRAADLGLSNVAVQFEPVPFITHPNTPRKKPMIASINIPHGFALLGQKYIEKKLSESDACALLLALQQAPELIHALWDQLLMHQTLREHASTSDDIYLTRECEASILCY